MIESESLMVELTKLVTDRHFGKYRGTVETVGTGDRLGYVRAIVPEIYGDVESPWAAPCVPAAGPGHGFFALPKEKDIVWIELEGGHPSSPLWTGFCWASGEAPEGGAPDAHVFASHDGHRIVLDDGNKKLTVAHSGGPSIEIEADAITLKVKTKSIEISSKGVKINGMALEVS